MNTDMISPNQGVPSVGVEVGDDNGDDIQVVPNVEDQAFEPQPFQTYDEAFPALHISEVSQGQPLPWVDQTHGYKFAVRSTKCTQVFTVPQEERKFKDKDEHNFGEDVEQAKICKDIMQKLGVSIEMSLAKDQSLTVVIHGKGDAVMKARRLVISQLQTQASIQIRIPREHHRFILGKKGVNIQELELATATKIFLPRNNESDVITIKGIKEGIDKAHHEIQCISDEQAKLAFERLPIPKIYHAFVCGPNNQTIRDLMDQTSVKINIPPLSVMKDEIVIAGEKEGVMHCKDVMMKIYEEKKRKCQLVSVEVRKSQHKYVIGPRGSGLHEILAKTGVAVEVPPLDDPSETITLRGEADKLGPALTMVYSKANSVVFAEVHAQGWLHRFIIGKGGVNVRKITEKFPKVHIEFTEGQEKITVEGPPEDVEQTIRELEDVIHDLESRMTLEVVDIPQRFHKHIIGKNGANVTRIKNETGVAIRIPVDAEKSDTIRIEGNPEGVIKAREALMEMAKRMENEKSKDIILEQRFHRTIIGSKGDRIKEIRDQFNQVMINFPEPGKKSDIVTLRGPKNDVDKLYKYLQGLNQEMIASNYQAEVRIFKQFHKNIIGKSGATIKKIRDETDTRIDLPTENSESDTIVITGLKANVEIARNKIEAIQKELANVKEITIEIPHKLHNSIIGTKGRLIRAIIEECGGVNIRFPPDPKSDKVVIKGPKEDVESAKKQLLDLANEKIQSSFTEEIRAKPEYHKFLIGRGGVNIKQVRDKTDARIVFPTTQDAEQDLITIIGKEDSVKMAKLELEARIKSLENIVEATINVDPKHHRHFVARRGEVLRQIAEDFGGVIVSFPRTAVKSDKVVLKGAKDCVDGAKKRIQEIVEDLDAQVQIECVISQKYHRTVMGAKGFKVQDITKRYGVGIKFPDRPISNVGPAGDTPTNPEEVVVNGDVTTETPGDAVDRPNRVDVIIITGKPEQCEEARDALLALVPITLEVNVPFEYHRFIIGQKGRDVRQMMEDYDVEVSVPPVNVHSDIIKVTGPPANVERAKVALDDKVELLDKEKEDRLLRSFQLTVEVDPFYHPKIIGRKGAIISKIRQDHDVNVQFPDKNDENFNMITITGYENNTHAAKEDILRIVTDLEDMTSVDVNIDYRVHSRIIGARGRGVRKMMDDYKVDVRFPRNDAENPNLVAITGQEADVYDCRDQLLNIEEEFLQDIVDQEYLDNLQHPPSRQHPSHQQRGPRNQGPGFVVRDAPWDSSAPDTSSTEEFPSFGASVAPQPRQSKSWGPGRKF